MYLHCTGMSSHRFLPIYAGLIMIDVAYSKYVGNGPFAPDPDSPAMDNKCSKYWWRNLLYINNFFKSSEMVRIISVTGPFGVDNTIHSLTMYMHL